MCGIYGYVGPRSVSEILLKGLERLEYRGYDSAGIALLPRNQELTVERAVGRVEQLRSRILRSPLSQVSDGLGLAHTRWATHGPALERNAHPHVDCSRKLAVVHNGIIENHDELRALLEARGHVFRSDTDTEVVSHLIESYFEGDLVAAVRAALPELRGSFAIGVIHRGAATEQIVVARSGSPLTIGIGEQEAFIASDVAPMLEYTRRVVFLQDGDLAVVCRNGITIFDSQAQESVRPVTEISWSAESADRGGFDHYMRKEIEEQPEALQKTLSGRVLDDPEQPVRLLELELLLQRHGPWTGRTNVVLEPWPGKCLPEPYLSRRRQRTFYHRLLPICAICTAEESFTWISSRAMYWSLTGSKRRRPRSLTLVFRRCVLD